MAGEADAARLGGQAVVIGAGMGGMMAAEVLSRHFDRVVLLDKDELPSGYEPRRGVPQGNHVHTLLTQGRFNLERLFPGFTQAVLENGATWAAALTEFKVCDPAGWMPEIDIDLHTVTCTRPLLEGTVRDLLNRNPRVEIRDQTRIESWRLEKDAVIGVEISDADGASFLPTDLVVDASGRAGRSLSWLEQAGYGPVDETTIEIGITYASAIFRRPEDWERGDETIIVAGDPRHGERSAGIFAVENGCWLVSLIGRFDRQPSTDPDEFMEFARQLEDPEAYSWMVRGERMTPIKVYHPRFSKWRRYDRLDRYPERVIPLGDALAQVNPARGQGMTLASTHAISLLELLEERASNGEGLKALARPYFDRVQGFTQTVWDGLEVMEYQCEGVKGNPPADIEQRIAFAKALREVAQDNAEVLKLLLRVNHLVDPPTVLQRPDIIEQAMAKMSEAA